MIHELFMRSKYFRELLCESLSVLFDCAVGTDAAHPVPPPADAAMVMRSKTLEYIERWNESYGEHYKHIRIGEIEPPSMDDLPHNESLDELYQRAPVVAAHPSLMHWGKKEVNLHKGIEVEHRFMGAANEEPIVSISLFSTLNQMTSVYQPPPRVIRECRYPLKKGGLCPRRDLKVCPFHGKIIERNDEGYPLEDVDPDDPDLLEFTASGPSPIKDQQEETPKKRKSKSGLVQLSRDPVKERMDQVFLMKDKKRR
eukprot:gene7780-9129_t